MCSHMAICCWIDVHYIMLDCPDAALVSRGKKEKEPFPKSPRRVAYNPLLLVLRLCTDNVAGCSFKLWNLFYWSGRNGRETYRALHWWVVVGIVSMVMQEEAASQPRSTYTYVCTSSFCVNRRVATQLVLPSLLSLFSQTMAVALGHPARYFT